MYLCSFACLSVEQNNECTASRSCTKFSFWHLLYAMKMSNSCVSSPFCELPRELVSWHFALVQHSDSLDSWNYVFEGQVVLHHLLLPGCIILWQKFIYKQRIALVSIIKKARASSIFKYSSHNFIFIGEIKNHQGR